MTPQQQGSTSAPHAASHSLQTSATAAIRKAAKKMTPLQVLGLVATLSLLLVFALSSLSSQPAPLSERQQLETQLASIYTEKVQLRLTKSDSLVRKLSLEAQLAAVKATLEATDSRLVELHQQEVMLSEKAALALNPAEASESGM